MSTSWRKCTQSYVVVGIAPNGRKIRRRAPYNRVQEEARRIGNAIKAMEKVGRP
jgi:uncharacterized protein (DUF736 family)